MLWDIIRDWFVMYIFGGYSSDLNNYQGMLGNGFNFDNFTWVDTDTANFVVPVKGYDMGYGSVVDGFTLGDWLSTTATIIVLTLMCIFLFICVRYLFKVGAGLFSNLRG